MTRTARRLLQGASTLVASLVFASAAVAQTVIGAGSLPGLAVDPAGTTYLAWIGPGGSPTPLHFCRLPRGESACAGGVKTIATPGTSLTRPFLKVDGSRVVVVQQRYGADVPGFSGVYAYTSTDGGETFGSGKLVGKHVLHEAVAGPGDTMSLVADSGGWFQNVPTDGSAPVDAEGRSTTGAAQLFADKWHVTGAIGLIDPATPLAMFKENGGATSQYRRYSGSGPINAQSSWTAPVQLNAPMNNFKLASGPAGLFLISVEGDYRLVSRKWIGTEFDEAVLIAPSASWPTLHASQDDGGRLHVTYGAGSNVMHATSDDGVDWRSGTVRTLTREQGGFGAPRIAAAPDHVGVLAWQGGETQPDIRVAAIGPDAPADPEPEPAPTPAPTPAAGPSPATSKPPGKVTATGTAKVVGRLVAVRLRLKLVLPKGVSKSSGCSGKVTAILLKGRKSLGQRSGKVDPRTCATRLTGTLKLSAVADATSLKVKVRFGGNAVLAASVQNKGVLKIKGRG